MSSFTLDDLRKDATKPAAEDSAPKQSSFTLSDLKSDAYRKGRAEADPLFRGLANTMNGPTFGFGDEIAGALLSVPLALKRGAGYAGVPQGYRDARDFVRGVQDQYSQEFPIGSTATQLAASAPVVTSNLLGQAATRVAPGTSRAVNTWAAVPRTGMSAIGARSAMAGASGAAYGGIAGAGESTADDLFGLTMDTGKGALISAGLGAATPGISAMAMGGYNQLATRVSNSAASSYAREKVAEALSRDARGGVFESGASNAGRQASARFGRANQVDPADAGYQPGIAIRQHQGRGPEARIVDAGGMNTRQLLDTTATLPGRTKNQVEAAIHDRQATRGDRLIQSADRQMGVNGQRLNEGIAGWAESRRLVATPLYNQVYAMRVQPTPQLQELVRAAEELGAGAQARRIATANRQPYELNAAGGGQLPMRQLDYLKQGLDDLVMSNTDDAGRMNKLGYAVNDLRRSLITELDTATTGANGQSVYQIARETYAGASSLMDAARRGKITFQQDEAAVRQAMNGLSGSEADAFRLGAFEALRGKLGKMAGQTEILNMWRDNATREKLQAVFGDERSFRQFAATAAREQRLKGMESAGRGSQTAARQYGAGDLDISPMTQAVTAASQGSPAGLMSAASGMWNRVRTPERVRDQIGSLLLSRDPLTMRDIEMLTPLVTADRNRRAVSAGGYAGLLGN